MNKRHINVHRTTHSPNSIIQWDEVDRPQDYDFINNYIEEMSETGTKPNTVKIPLGVNNIQIMWYFENLPDINVVDACANLLNIMKDMGAKTQTQFP